MPNPKPDDRLQSSWDTYMREEGYKEYPCRVHNVEMCRECYPKPAQQWVKLFKSVQEWTAKFPLKYPASEEDKNVADELYLEVTNILNALPDPPARKPLRGK